jgi:hypothetical protein
VEPGGGLKYAASMGAHSTGVFARVAAMFPPIFGKLVYERIIGREKRTYPICRWVGIVHPVSPEW